MRIKYLLAIFLLVYSFCICANKQIKLMPFINNSVVPLQASTFTATEIQFEDGEIVENIQNGDVAAWTVDIEKNMPNILFVKPTITNSNTNMTVITNKRSYYFHLMSAASKLGNATYALKFIYPEKNKQHLSRHATINWDYSFHGSKSIMPLHVFDDGQFTYLQLRLGQPVPAIFAVDTKKANESVVNFRREGRYLVIHRIIPQLTLREGPQQVASIFNNHLIAHLRKGF